LKWNAEAKEQRQRKRVFCASMADVFEARDELSVWRERLWQLIMKTDWLDWLLLTKRPQNIDLMAPWTDEWPQNVWLGTTIEDQTRAEERLPSLLKHRAKTRFLSCEPLLGTVDLSQWIGNKRNSSLNPIDWVIAGGESGPNARPMLPRWVRTLRDQCRAEAIAFHFKQWGHWAPTQQLNHSSTVKEFWDDVAGEQIVMEAKGKKVSGRRLDGITWDELPTAA